MTVITAIIIMLRSYIKKSFDISVKFIVQRNIA